MPITQEINDKYFIRNYTSEDFKKDFDTALQMVVDAGFKEIQNNTYSLVLKAKGLKCLGLCQYNTSNHFTIYLNQYYANIVSEKEILVTLIHEICHSVTPFDGHGTKWKRVVNVMNMKYNFNIKRTTTSIYSEWRKDVKFSAHDNQRKYDVVCLKCGHEYHYQRDCKAIEGMLYHMKHPETKGYHCGHCKSYDLKVIQNY